MGKRRGVNRVLVGKPEKKIDPDVDGRIILNGSSVSGVWGLWTGSSSLRIGTDGGHL
jgi:hypothetical protein